MSLMYVLIGIRNNFPEFYRTRPALIIHGHWILNCVLTSPTSVLHVRERWLERRERRARELGVPFATSRWTDAWMEPLNRSREFF